MSNPIKKTALFMIIFGLTLIIISGFFGYREYQIITTGQEISGTVSEITETQTSIGILYQPTFSYIYEDQDYFYTPRVKTYINQYDLGDIETLVIGNKGITIQGIHTEIVGIGIGLLSGLIFLLMGISWIIKIRKNIPDTARLKRIGYKIQVEFLDKEILEHIIDGHQGVILMFQEIETEDTRVYMSPPIFSEFSIQFLNEHIFDVYLDPTNNQKYYIDLEKHFGYPESHS